MNTSTLISNAGKLLKSNAPQILTAVGVTGVATTAYLTGKASIEAADIIRANEEAEGVINDPKERLKERVKHVWKLYIPAAVSGTATIVCIVSSSRAGAHRAAAAVTAYSVTEKAFADYRDKVVEQIGSSKEKKIRDELAQEHVTKNPPSQIIMTGRGEVLCCERYTGRYFKSDIELLRKAQNDVNAMVVNELYVALDEFYDLVGLGPTCVSDSIGWTSEKLLELKFSTVLSEGGEPCLAFEYNYVKPL